MCGRGWFILGLGEHPFAKKGSWITYKNQQGFLVKFPGNQDKGEVSMYVSFTGELIGTHTSAKKAGEAG